MNLVTVIDSTIDNLKRRVQKYYRYGFKNAETSQVALPYGLDSNCIGKIVAVYAKTGNNGDDLIIGYININQKADVGEFRTFATDEDGNETFYTWLKNDGTYEIGGNSNYAVKYNELVTEFNKLKTNFNNHLTEYNSHTHAGVTIGTGITGITAPSINTNTSDITQTKNDKIKTI